MIPFYFTDFKSFKFRPAVIVSLKQSQPDDFIVAFISTIIPSKERIHPSHYIVEKKEHYFKETGLHTTSIIKCDKLMTINRSIIEGRLKELPKTILDVLGQKLMIALSLQ